MGRAFSAVGPASCGTLIGSVILCVLSTGLILMNVQFFTQLLIPQPEAPLPANL